MAKQKKTRYVKWLKGYLKKLEGRNVEITYNDESVVRGILTSTKKGYVLCNETIDDLSNVLMVRIIDGVTP